MLKQIASAYLLLHSYILYRNQWNVLALHCLYLLFLGYRVSVSRQSITVPHTPASGGEAANSCLICNRLKPARFYHCRKCQKCIYRMDHHCYWVDNCIGHFNTKIYVHLLTNLALASLSSSLSALFSWFIGQLSWHLSILIIPSLYFLYQSIRLLHQFRISIKQNQTLVETYKEVYGKRQAPMKTFIEYFGVNGWLIPSEASTAQCDIMERVYGNAPVKEKRYADEYMYGSDSEDESEEKSLSDPAKEEISSLRRENPTFLDSPSHRRSNCNEYRLSGQPHP